MRRILIALFFTSFMATSVQAETFKPSLSYSKASSGYTHVRAGLVKSENDNQTDTLVYLSKKTVTEIDWGKGLEYSTTRLGVEITDVNAKSKGYGGVYLYSNDTDSDFFNKEGLGFGLGFIADMSPKIRPFVYGEFNFEFLSTSWTKVDLEYNLQTGIDYIISNHVRAGLFYEHQGYSASNLFNSTYSTTGLKMEFKI